MREFKFRGYATEELVGSQWITNGYGVTKIEYTDGTNSVHILAPYGDYQVEEESVGQYTGLKDKNNKEIFEGDILEFIFEGDTKISNVTYDLERGFYLEFESFGRKSKYNASFLTDYDRRTKIIGNIYENPELLTN